MKLREEHNRLTAASTARMADVESHIAALNDMLQSLNNKSSAGDERVRELEDSLRKK